MRDPGLVSATAVPGSGEPKQTGRDPAAPDRSSGDRGSAALAPIPAPVSAAGNLVPTTRAEPPSADTAEAAQGRRVLSTAFVMVGADGYLTMERRDGRVIVLRNVVMRPADYCGTRAIGGAKARYCGGYAEVAAARPGGGPAPLGSNAAATPRDPAERR